MIVKRERHRYILFKIILKENLTLDNNTILRAIWSSIWRYFGLKEASKVGLWLFEFNIEHNLGIIRISHSTKEMVIAALTLIRNINGESIIFSPIRTSGTINRIKLIMNNLLKDSKIKD